MRDLQSGRFPDVMTARTAAAVTAAGGARILRQRRRRCWRAVETDSMIDVAADGDANLAASHTTRHDRDDVS